MQKISIDELYQTTVKTETNSRDNRHQLPRKQAPLKYIYNYIYIQVV